MDLPKLYSKSKEMQTRDNIFLVKKYFKLVKWTNEEETILDIGCGEGFTTLEILLPSLPKNFKKIVGCDISDKMVKFAKKSYEKHPRVEFCKLDVSGEIPNKGFREEFDHVFSFYCLHWVSAQKKAFENIYKLLKPGGDVLASLVVTAPIFEVFESIGRDIRWASYYKKNMISPYHHSEKPDEELKAILEDVGFTDCQCIVESRHYAFANWDVMRRAVIAVNPIIPILSPSDKPKFIEFLMDQIRKYYGYDHNLNFKNKIPVDYKLLVVYASKPKIAN